MTAPKHTLFGRKKILAALGVTSLALLGASPANAIDRGYEPAEGESPVIERSINADDRPSGMKDENGMYYCWSKNDDGTWSGHRHGSTRQVWDHKQGKYVTLKCNNGNWQAAAITTGIASRYYHVLSQDGLYYTQQ